jgi:putative MATE family efflux protein
MGVTGAAVATTIGRGIGVVYQLYYLLGGRGRLEFRLRHLALEIALMRRMIIISIGGIGQFLIATASWIVIMRIVAFYGSAAIAAYTIALRIIEFVFLPAWGLGNAAATLVGQNLGAGQPDRAEASAWQAARYNAIFMTGLGLLSFIAAPAIANLFSNEPEVLRYGANCIRILGVGYPMYAVGMIMIQALNGAGDTATPSALNLLAFWLVQIPLAWLLAEPLAFGPNGVFWAIVMSESLLTVLSVVVFRRGNWKRQAA